MSLSRRDFVRLTAGTGALAAIGQLGRSAAIASPAGNYRAMVGVFLFGGNDGWNMVIPTDARHAPYLAARGSVGIPASALTALGGTPYALHPAMEALRPVWNEGALGLVLNAGTLFAPLTKSVYQARADLRPSNLMSHSDEQAHWQGLRARAFNHDGFMGRIADRAPATPMPCAMSIAGANVAVMGQTSAPLVLPSSGALTRTGYSTSANAANLAKNAALDVFGASGAQGTLTDATARTMSAAYSQAAVANTILSASSPVDSHFAGLNSDVARQLQRVARMIEARSTLGHARQSFFVSHGGYDLHSAQVSSDTATGPHAQRLGELAAALAAFHGAMKGLGLSENVTSFTMSDFGRTFQGNAQMGTDHAWGSNHLVMGGALAPRMVHGRYPDPVLGGGDDIDANGRFIPGIAQEEYIGAIARWHGVADSDLPYVFPNWSTWSTAGRGPLGLFGA